jgi:hypothetical protein
MWRTGSNWYWFVALQVKENKEKVKLNNQLPYLVGNVVEVLDIKPEDDNEEDGMAVDLDSQRKGASISSSCIVHNLCRLSTHHYNAYCIKHVCCGHRKVCCAEDQHAADHIPPHSRFG